MNPIKLTSGLLLACAVALTLATGPFVQAVIPACPPNVATGAGDPHFTTFDGKYYDFQGSGIFEFCKSPTAGFEVHSCQTPYAAYPSVALNNGVAFRGGGSVDTRFSVFYDVAGWRYFKHPDPATGWVEVAEADLAAAPLVLRGDGATLSIFSVTLSTTPWGSRNLLITTADGTSLSVGLNGFYLDLYLTPSNTAHGDTSGMCGNWNCNPNDDLLSYPNSNDYVESLRRGVTSASLFPAAAIPVCTGGIAPPPPPPPPPPPAPVPVPTPIVEVPPPEDTDAEECCTTVRGLTRGTTQWNACVTDVAATGRECDDDPNYDPECTPELCNTHGTCRGGECFCFDGWQGDFCETPDCGCLNDDVCINGICTAPPDETGSENGGHGSNGNGNGNGGRECSGHGDHDDDDNCICHPGYAGVQCEWSAQMICAGHGTPVSATECTCDAPWTGFTCELSRDTSCSGHGDPSNEGVCTCDAGWVGATCAVVAADCAATGTPIADGTCLCAKGWAGARCETCAPGFTGAACDQCDVLTYGPNCRPCKCTNGGVCDRETGACTCPANRGWSGTYCETCATNWRGVACAQCAHGFFGAQCESECVCAHGKCREGRAGDGVCVRPPGTGWEGAALDVCPPNWRGNACNACAHGFYGAACEKQCHCPHGRCLDGRTGSGACVKPPGSGWTGDAFDVCPSNWAGASCRACARGFFGANCENRCTCVHGCDDGIAGTGACARPPGTGWEGDALDVCPPNWRGARCNACNTGFYGPECAPCPKCQHGGRCNGGNSGDGTCVCPIASGWSGALCETCADGWSGSKCDRCASGAVGAACLTA